MTETTPPTPDTPVPDETSAESTAETLFRKRLPFEDGIYRGLEHRPKAPLAQQSNFVPLTAWIYEPVWRRYSLSILTGGSYSVERELALMRERLEPRPGDVILDAACSAGLYARTLLEHHPATTVHALDYSLPFLRQARRYAERDDVDPVLVHADVRALPYRDAVFDHIVCGGSLNEFTDLGAHLSELSRVLKPGGLMWQMYLTRAESWYGRLFQGLLSLPGLRFFEVDKVDRTMRDVGMRPLRAEYRGVVSLAVFSKE
ncbi:MAG: class I SAM-dependent methyltransferase [Trueperaceae bacterium]|nr:class I SAM-dependent methyltransferase [Trueperaceae bacterium]